MSVTNVLGEKVYQSEIINQKSQIDLSSQPAGVYFLRLKNEEEVFTQKIILSR